MSETDKKLKDHLGYFKHVCKQSKDAYDIHAVHLKNRHNLITFPLLIITSATGVIAAVDVQKTAGIIVGAASAVLTAIQRYCAYSERSENARMTAKSFARLVRKIENIELAIESKSKIVEMTDEMKAKYVTEIQAELDSAQENAKDVPWELLKYIETIDAQVCCVSVKGPSAGS